jgi:hypothetical protein
MKKRGEKVFCARRWRRTLSSPRRRGAPGCATSCAYNPERAEEDSSSREKALGKAERELSLLRHDLSGERKRRGRKLTHKGVMLEEARIQEELLPASGSGGDRVQKPVRA